MRGGMFVVSEPFGGFRVGDIVDIATGRMARRLTAEERLSLLGHMNHLTPAEAPRPATPEAPLGLRVVE